MDEAVTVPEYNPGPFNLLSTVASKGFLRVPDYHLLRGDAHLLSRVPAEVLIGEKENLFTPAKGPIKGGWRIG